MQCVSSNGGILVQVWQVAGVSLVAVAFLCRNSNQRSRVLSSVLRKKHLLFGLFLQKDLDWVVWMDASQLSIVTQHFGCNLIGDTVFSRGSCTLFWSDGSIPLWLVGSFSAFGLRYTRDIARLWCLGSVWFYRKRTNRFVNNWDDSIAWLYINSLDSFYLR